MGYKPPLAEYYLERDAGNRYYQAVKRSCVLVEA